MEISTHLKKRAKDYGVPWPQLVMADLMAIGYSEADAYGIAFYENSTLNVQRNLTVRKNTVRSQKFQELLLARKKAVASLADKTYDEDGDIVLIGAEETAKELLKVAQTMPEGSKERGEMFVRYADLIRKNDTRVSEDDDPVRIYLPMKCSMCALRDAHDAENKQK